MNVLVLGIGQAQVDLLKLLKGKHTVHALSYTPEGQGRKYADYFEQIDIKNREAVLDYAQINDIELVCSLGSDLGMVTSAWVSHALQLPTFVSPELAAICNRKNLLRNHLNGLMGNVSFKVLRSLHDFGDFGFPCVIKPVDSQGQRGVFVVQNQKQLRNQFSVSQQYSTNNQVIVEEYVEGPEISVNAYVVDGEVRISLISDRIVWPDLPGGLIHKHRIPSQVADRETEKRIRRLVSEVILQLKIKNGPVYFQIKLEQNRPKLIEVTPRLDGCHLWRLIEHATGIDLLDITVRHLVEGRVDMPGRVSFTDSRIWTLEFMCEKPGTVINFNKYDVSDSLYHEWYYEPGDTVRPVNTYMEKCGCQIYAVHEPLPAYSSVYGEAEECANRKKL